MCQAWGVKKEGSRRILRIPDQRLGPQGNSWCHGWCYFTPRKIPWKCCVDIFNGSVPGMGVKKRGIWRMFKVSEQRLGGHGHSWCHWWSYFTPRKIPWKFCVDIFSRSVSGMRGQEGGYLENIEGSWLETWRIWSSLMLWMTFVYPEDHILKVSGFDTIRT